MSEHQIVVVFDVAAPDRQQAAEALDFVLGPDGLLDELRFRVSASNPSRDVALESWWFPEADLKQVDGNDNGAFVLIRDDREPPAHAPDDREHLDADGLCECDCALCAGPEGVGTCICRTCNADECGLHSRSAS